MSRDRSPLRTLRSRIAGITLALLIIFTGVPLSSSALARQADEDPPVDLAAMVLRPSDFEAEGVELMGEARYNRDAGRWNYLPTGRMTLPEAVAESAVAALPDHLVNQLYLDLAEAGWRQQFRSVLSSPSDTTPIFVSSVAEYAEEDGAEAAFDLLTNSDDVPGVRELDDVPDIGDESAAHRDTSSLLVLDGDRITVMFRVGQFIGTVRVYEYEPVERDLLAALAERTIDRIEQVLDGELGGLSHLALRLNTGVAPFIERYDLLDSDFLPFSFETGEEREERAARFGDLTDAYRLDQSIPLDGRELYDVPRYAVIIDRYEDEDAAADFMTELPDRLERTPLDDVAEFGDESLAFAEEFDWLDVTHAGFRMFVRVGDIVVNIVIDAPEDAPDLEILENLMEVQIQCLEDGACPVQPIPAGLLDFTCAPGPVDEADDPLNDEIEGDVPMAGGDAAQTGEQPGPGPDGDPELLWRFDTAGLVGVAPVIVDGLVVFGAGNGALADGGDGNLYALDAVSGKRAWCRPTGGTFLSTIAFEDEMLVGAVNDPRVQEGAGSAIVALDPATGEEQWRAYIGGRAGDLLIDGETVFVPAGGNLTAIGLETGETLWQFVPSDRDDDTISSTAIADGVIYVTYYGGLEQPERIYALDTETGEERWTFDDIDEEQSFSRGLAVADGLLFVGVTDGGLYALDAEDGEEVWRFAPETENGSLSFREPAVVDGVVYTAGDSDRDQDDVDPYLFAIDAETGEEIWRYETGDPLPMQASIADGVAYVGDLTGLLYAVDIESGEELWTFELEGELGTSSPAVVDGVLYVTDRDGSLYAIAGEDR